tara:strand:+ start:1433 stop:1723 length:291 start_codon:yes stop_codon:yes gene_type:complete
MLTRNIIELLKATPDLNSTQIANTFGKKKTIMTCTLNYLFRRNILIRNLSEDVAQTKGRKKVYIYRVNDAALKDGTGMVVGKIRTVSDKERSPASV